jgi:zinc transport system permease protein
MDSFLLHALLAGGGIALVAGPVGSLLLWRRMAFLGDTLSHGALIGIAASLWIEGDMTWGILGVSFLMAGLILALQHHKTFSNEVILSLLSYGSLSLGIILLSQIPGNSGDLSGYLFGDILACTPGEIGTIYGGGLLIMLLLWRGWRWMLLTLISPEIAAIEGAPVKTLNFIFTFIISLTVALSLHVVGILLLGALLIIPAATAQRFSRSPEQMAILASCLGLGAVTVGLGASLAWNTPTSPTIVVTSLAFFLGSFLFKRRLG